MERVCYGTHNQFIPGNYEPITPISYTDQIDTKKKIQINTQIAVQKIITQIIMHNIWYFWYNIFTNINENIEDKTQSKLNRIKPTTNRKKHNHNI